MNQWYNIWMKRLVLGLISLVLISFLSPVKAQTPTSVVETALLERVASDSADASASAEATASSIVRRVVERKPDITEPEGEVKTMLEITLEQNPLRPLNPMNFVQHLIRNAVTQGVPANTIVLVLLFPVVTMVIAASRHVIGLKGFGIFTPALLAVGFLATDIIPGLILFGVMLLVVSILGPFIKKLRMPHMPRTSLVFQLMSLSVLGLLLIAPKLNLDAITALSIFPVLLFVWLTETFIRAQVKTGRRQALEMTFETLIMSLICFFIMDMGMVQRFVLLRPELTILLVGLANYGIGRFSGLRVIERIRFKEIID